MFGVGSGTAGSSHTRTIGGKGMDLGSNEQHGAIDAEVRKVCAQFGDDYWTECEETPRFPEEYYRAMANGGWLGITMPEAVGGAGLGVTEAAVMMHAATSSGGGYSAASAIHINLFGPHSIVVHGSPEQQQRWLKPLVAGEEKACFGVTEPDAGLDTTSIKTVATRVTGGYRVSGRKMWTSTAQVADKILLLTRTTPKTDCKKPTDGMTLFYTELDRSKIEVRRIHKMGRNAVDSNAVFIDDIFIPEADRIGEEGKAFGYILHSLNPERILVASEAIGLGRDAIRRASDYARDRVVFGRPIGQNQGIQHPLAECWAFLEAAYWMMLRAASLYDSGAPCGAAANAAKFLGGRAAFNACTQAVLTHGGMGYAREYQVERLFRESILTRIAPITEQLILSFLAERVLNLPKSY
jgi:acyl-CoA dehydrogenase